MLKSGHRHLPTHHPVQWEEISRELGLRLYLAVSSSFLAGSRAMSAMYSSCCRMSIKGPSLRWSHNRIPPVSSPVTRTFSSTSSRLLMGAL